VCVSATCVGICRDSINAIKPPLERPLSVTTTPIIKPVQNGFEPTPIMHRNNSWTNLSTYRPSVPAVRRPPAHVINSGDNTTLLTESSEWSLSPRGRPGATYWQFRYRNMNQPSPANMYNTSSPSSSSEYSCRLTVGTKTRTHRRARPARSLSAPHVSTNASNQHVACRPVKCVRTSKTVPFVDVANRHRQWQKRREHKKLALTPTACTCTLVTHYKGLLTHATD
jgi:hypothetical protein